MAFKQTNCIYCGQAVRLTYEQGRPKALQNGRVHKCSFSKLGIRNGEAGLGREPADAGRGNRKSNRASKWAFWAGLFG
jgi:hypothetical protein